MVKREKKRRCEGEGGRRRKKENNQEKNSFIAREPQKQQAEFSRWRVLQSQRGQRAGVTSISMPDSRRRSMPQQGHFSHPHSSTGQVFTLFSASCLISTSPKLILYWSTSDAASFFMITDWFSYFLSWLLAFTSHLQDCILFFIIALDVWALGSHFSLKASWPKGPNMILIYLFDRAQ